jgi:polar amino acid transport system substrate-binding protein
LIYKKFFLFALLAAGILLGPWIVSAQETEAVTARVSDWKPAFWLDKGAWRGMDIDFYKALEKASGLEFHYVNLPWSRALRSLELGECTLMTQLSRVPEREAYIHFLGPYNSEEMVLVVHKEDAHLPINSLDDMVQAARQRGLKIGIEANVYYGEAFSVKMQEDPDFKNHFEYSRPTQAEMMAKKRLFGLIDQRIVIAHNIRNDPVFKDLAIHSFTLNSDFIYIGVSKRVKPHILERLRRAVEDLRADETFRKIESKWKK